MAAYGGSRPVRRVLLLLDSLHARNANVQGSQPQLNAKTPNFTAISPDPTLDLCIRLSALPDQAVWTAGSLVFSYEDIDIEIDSGERDLVIHLRKKQNQAKK